jgi:uncharacterized membrane protein YbhN (UPF0104 family)
MVGVLFLVRALQGVNLSQVADDIKAASIPLLLLALVVAQTPRFTWAVTTRAACPKPVPYGPIILLQLTIPFFNLLAPYAAARVAVNIRFFRRQGLSSASAVSIGLIDTLGGALVEVLIVIVALIVGYSSFNINFHRSDTSGDGELLHFLVLLAIIVFAIVALTVVVPPLRRRVVRTVRPWLKEAGQTVAQIRSPGRLARILGGNLASELLLALTLFIIVHAYGQSTAFVTLVVVNVSVVVFANFIPVPGGIGVVEGALAVGLTAAGINQATALACALTYRMFTFYLPPIWGWFAYRALRRRGMF